MSAFCVFGVTRQDCIKRARAKVSTRDPKTKKDLSPEEWAERVAAMADELFDAANPKQISPSFDSPQFCREWIEIGLRGSPPQIRAPRIMVKGKKVDAKGKERTRKGMPVIGWIRYAEPAQRELKEAA